jgi:hypothetical protein
MKKLILLGASAIMSIGSFAQTVAKTPPAKGNTFEIEAKGLGNSTWLFNTNISNLGASQNYAAAWGFNYGLGFTAFFGNIGVGVEGLMGNHRGGYSGTIDYKDSTGKVTSSVDYKSNVNLKVIQIPIFFKLKTDKGGYLEIGPQYNMISSAQYKRTGTGLNADTTVTNMYAKTYFSAVLGFGFKARLGKSPLSISAGIRLQYSFTDLKGVDGLGQDLNNIFIYSKPAPTAAATGGLMLGLVYQLGGKKE